MRSAAPTSVWSNWILVEASGSRMSTLSADEVVECRASKILGLLGMPLVDSAERDATPDGRPGRPIRPAAPP